MKQYDGLFRYLCDILKSTRKVETTGLGVVVSVLLHVEACSLKYGHVIAPRWRWLINFLWTLVKVSQKVSANSEGASS